MKSPIYKEIIPDGFGYKAMTLYPYILVKKGKKLTGEEQNHEMIHFYQQEEMGLLPFLLSYLKYFISGMIINKFNWKLAYSLIPFEQEAYDNMDNLDYLKTRRVMAWLNYNNKA